MIQSSPRHGDALFLSRTVSIRYTAPEYEICCVEPAALPAALADMDAALAAGLHLAGFIGYEAGWPLADMAVPDYAGHDDALPLLWLGAYREPERAPRSDRYPGASVGSPDWTPDISHDRYRRDMAAIRAYICAGDTYQVNYSFPLRATFEGDPLAWFYALFHAQPTDHAAYLDLGRFKILSLSPELFFRVDGERISTRPMKGTCRRGPYPEADDAARIRLANSVKDRAENLMIVDLLRNDLGRIAPMGTVAVDSLFDVERYATVWQMTSAIHARSDAPPSETLRALFPCGSVTGAPKRRSMEIIAELERRPRGVYCGAVGWWTPERRALFNVAIRTITLDTKTGSALYPVGGGITWDSSVEGEYDECLAKAETLFNPRPDFELVETLLYDDGYFLRAAHLDRMCASAAYFDIPVERASLEQALSQAADALSGGRWKVRLLLDRRGRCRVETGAAPAPARVDLGLAVVPVDASDPFLYHKTTHRRVYDRARAACPGCDDVLLWNNAGELTETTLGNIVVDFGDGRPVTPPIACGLLPGVMRGALLREGRLHEQVVRLDELPRARALYVINSVRKQCEAFLCGISTAHSPG